MALVLECARANGDIVSSRKGILDLRLDVTGRAAHAGVEPEKGRSAILEAARIVERPARAQRPLAGGHRQRRRDRRRDATERRPRALLARGRRPGDHSRGARGCRSRGPPRSPRPPRSRTRPSSSRRWPAGGRWRSSSGSARLVEHAQAVAARPRLRGPRCRDRRRLGRQHDLGDGRPEPRRPRARSAATTTRPRSTSTSSRSCRGRRCWPGCCWRSRATRRSWPGATPRRHRVTGAGRHDPSPLISSGGPWEASAGYSRAVVVGDACWVAGTTDAGPDGRSRHPGDIGAQARAALAIIERALDEAGFALADVVRTRMFVTDIARSARSSPRHGAAFGVDPAGRDAGRGQRADRSEPARRDRGRRPSGDSTRGDGRARRAGQRGDPERPRHGYQRDRADQADEQVAPPGHERTDRRRPRPTRSRRGRRTPGRRRHDHDVDRGQRGQHGRADEPQVVEGARAAGARSRAPAAAAPATGRSRRTSAGPGRRARAHGRPSVALRGQLGIARSAMVTGRGRHRLPGIGTVGRAGVPGGRLGRAARGTSSPSSGPPSPPTMIPIAGPASRLTADPDAGPDERRDELAPAGDQPDGQPDHRRREDDVEAEAGRIRDLRRRWSRRPASRGSTG